MKTFADHVHDCLDNTARTVREWKLQGSWDVRKPHLRLHYQHAVFSWCVEYVRGPSQRVRRTTYPSHTARDALGSARNLWF